ncbi:MAG: metallophosphoesterase [Gudongella sp.]|nr:metallophosphoesterase [Gudongella sp.]
MKILVVADTHNVTAGIMVQLQKEKADMLFFLGDFVKDGEDIKRKLEIPAYIIAGNGDWASYYKKEELVKVRDKRILLTHGQQYNVKNSLQRLYYHGIENRADVILYAHTHIPYLNWEEKVLIMNPGSPTFPRGGSNIGTYGILNIGSEITAEIVKCHRL